MELFIILDKVLHMEEQEEEVFNKGEYIIKGLHMEEQEEEVFSKEEFIIKVSEI